MNLVKERALTDCQIVILGNKADLCTRGSVSTSVDQTNSSTITEEEESKKPNLGNIKSFQGERIVETIRMNKTRDDFKTSSSSGLNESEFRPNTTVDALS